MYNLMTNSNNPRRETELAMVRAAYSNSGMGITPLGRCFLGGNGATPTVFTYMLMLSNPALMLSDVTANDSVWPNYMRVAVLMAHDCAAIDARAASAPGAYVPKFTSMDIKDVLLPAFAEGFTSGFGLTWQTRMALLVALINNTGLRRLVTPAPDNDIADKLKLFARIAVQIIIEQTQNQEGAVLNSALPVLALVRIPTVYKALTEELAEAVSFPVIAKYLVGMKETGPLRDAVGAITQYEQQYVRSTGDAQAL